LNLPISDDDDEGDVSLDIDLKKFINENDENSVPIDKK